MVCVRACLSGKTVNIKKLVEHAVIPKYAKPGDAAMDLVATSVNYDPSTDTYIYGTGLSMEIPTGYVGMIYPRSSVYKTAVVLANQTGVVDSKFRGEVKVLMRRDSSLRDIYNVGDRIAQIMIIECPHITFKEVEEIDMTGDRGGGFGSTGK